MEDDDDNFRDKRQPEGWHLDKWIPIATLVAILILTLGGILHITQIRTDLGILRQQQTALAERLERILIRRGVITRKDIDDEDATV